MPDPKPTDCESDKLCWDPSERRYPLLTPEQFDRLAAEAVTHLKPLTTFEPTNPPGPVSSP